MKAIFVNLLAQKQKGQLETAVLAKLFDRSIKRPDKMRTKRSTRHEEAIEDLVRSMTEFSEVADKAVDEIHTFTSNLRNMAKECARSTRATQIFKNFEAIISTYAPTKQVQEYSTSSYATGNTHWRRSTLPDQRTIQELLLEDIRAQHNNGQLGKKIEHITQQVETLKQQASNFYDPPSVRLSRDPIMPILTKLVSTYMFLKHLNHPREANEI
jgi:hypothetical protein